MRPLILYDGFSRVKESESKDRMKQGASYLPEHMPQSKKEGTQEARNLEGPKTSSDKDVW